MKVVEIRAIAWQAVEALRNARAGQGTCDYRSEQRTKAGELLESLPQNWWRRISDSESDEIMEHLGRLA